MRLFLRADGGRAIGLGHLMRCHALAQEARRRGLAPCFLTRPGDRTGIAKLQALGESVVPLSGPERCDADLAATLGAMRLAMGEEGLRSAVLITDHNGLDEAWLRGAKEAGPVVVSLNDLPRVRYASHLVVNGNLGAEKLPYQIDPGVAVLAGPAYCIFRDAFCAADLSRTHHPPIARRITLSMGAGDPDNVTQDILEGLEGWPGPLTIDAVLGAAYAHGEALSEAARRSRHAVRVERDLPEPASVFAAAEMAVCGGGSTAYEMAMLGVPALVVVLSETQKAPGEALAEAGAALCVARADLAKGLEDLAALRDDPDARRRMGERGRALFDGLGRGRILDAALRMAEGAQEGAAR